MTPKDKIREAWSKFNRGFACHCDKYVTPCSLCEFEKALTLLDTLPTYDPETQVVIDKGDVPEGLREAIKLGQRVLITMKFPKQNPHVEIKAEAIKTHSTLLETAALVAERLGE